MKHKITISDSASEYQINICKEYWDEEMDSKVKKYKCSVDDICEKHSLKQKELRELIKGNSYVTTNSGCSSCGLMKYYTSRSQVRDNDYSICEGCQLIEEQKRADKKQILNTFIQEQTAAINKLLISASRPLDDVRIIDKYLLVAYLKCYSNIDSLNDREVISTPFCTNICQMSSSRALDLEIINYLFKQKYLCVASDWVRERYFSGDLTADISSVTEQDLQVISLSTVYEKEALLGLIKEVFSTNLNDDLLKNADYEIWCSKLQLHECLNFLIIFSNEYSLIPKIGNAIINEIKNCLKYFPVNVTNYFIWSAVKNAAAYAMKPHISRIRAENSIAGSISRVRERVLLNQQKKIEFNRYPDCHQSLLSQFFYDNVYRLHDCGFNRTSEEISDFRKTIINI